MASITMGVKKLNRLLAHRPEVADALQHHANAIGRHAEANLAARPEHEANGAKIEVSHGDVDWYISLVDPNALSIEFGRADYIDPDTHERWGGMEGTYILTDAANLPHKRQGKRTPRKERRRGWVT